jgi:hypothetical protein
MGSFNEKHTVERSVRHQSHPRVIHLERPIFELNLGLAAFLHAPPPWPTQLSDIQNHGRLENPWWCSIADYAEWLIGTTWDDFGTSGTKNYCDSQSTFWIRKIETDAGSSNAEDRIQKTGLTRWRPASRRLVHFGGD